MLIGSDERPLAILADGREALVIDGCDAKKCVSGAWKASYEGLIHGFGYGTAMLDLSFAELVDLAEYSEMLKKHGDFMEDLSCSQCPLELEEQYVGLAIQSELYVMGTRPDTNAMFESMLVAQQHVLGLILERGLREALYGADNDRSPTFQDIAFVSKVCCRFGLRVPKSGGMRDFLRVVEAGRDVAGVGKDGGWVFSRSVGVPESSTHAWDGWVPNPKSASENTKCGSFIISTVLPSVEGALSDQSVERAGVFFTVTERIVRCYTGSQGEDGLFYEYVAAFGAMDKSAVRIMFLTIGSSIVLPSTFAVRIGGHDTLTIQVVGCVIRTETLTKEDYEFYAKELCDLVENLCEYGANVTFLDSRSLEEGELLAGYSDVDTNGFMIGTIPTLVNVELNNDFRSRMVEDMYDALPGALSLAQVFIQNPIVRIDGGADNDGSQWKNAMDRRRRTFSSL
ncbi:hypothetical protein FGB62_66g131 [Gracilaria domingensis]|nr:hypothetical protein FGB62_66g131 [Gracilaria domingensis]